MSIQKIIYDSWVYPIGKVINGMPLIVKIALVILACVLVKRWSAKSSKPHTYSKANDNLAPVSTNETPISLPSSQRTISTYQNVFPTISATFQQPSVSTPQVERTSLHSLGNTVHNDEILQKCKEGYEQTKSELQKRRDFIQETIEKITKSKSEMEASLQSKAPFFAPAIQKLYRIKVSNYINMAKDKISFGNSLVKTHNFTVKSLQTFGINTTQYLIPETNALTEELAKALASIGENIESA